MSSVDDKKFWSTQTSSRHRANDPDFYSKKAAEHAALMTDEDRLAGCLDIGCGAGELLVHLADRVNVETGVDYSQSMLDRAAEALDGRDVKLMNVDIFDYLPPSKHAVWMTTGAINQYLDSERMRAFLDIFAANETARSLFLFDCVDPIRYNVLPYGGSYVSRPIFGSGLGGFVRRAKRIVRRAMTATELAAGLLSVPCKKLSSVGMGYGYQPWFWLEAARDRALSVEIVSSRYYEYRYHVILRKA